MRKTGPVTQIDHLLNDSDQLVSSTNLKGVITDANDEFCRIAGFKKEELVGQAHNLVRHPDMPPAAFALLWENVLKGNQWRGIVKNRCKNGDHYWVDAYVMPVYENNEIVAFESVRQKPRKEWVERAERVYRNIFAGKKPIPLYARIVEKNLSYLKLAGLCLSVLVGGLLFLGSIGWLMGLVAFVVGFIVMRASSTVKFVNSSLSRFNDDEITQYIFTGHLTPDSRVELLNSFHQRHLHTVLERMNQEGDALRNMSDENKTRAQGQFNAVEEEKNQLDGVSSAVLEMSHSVQEIAGSAESSAHATGEANEQVKASLTELKSATSSIEQLVETMNDTVEIVNQLAADSEEIRTVISVISGIADQTNLLALNAAIEAARAGEQGRGFAVVADEVRSLASKTQDSTETISNIINKLIGVTHQTVDSIGVGSDVSVKTKESMELVQANMNELAKAIETVNANTEVIADLSGQQAVASDEVSKNTEAVLELTGTLAGSSEDALDFSRQLYQQAEKQAQIIRRFR